MITLDDKIKELKRELGQRARVYPRLIEAGKMTQAVMDRQIAIMEAIKADYERQAEEDAAKGRLI